MSTTTWVLGVLSIVAWILLFVVSWKIAVLLLFINVGNNSGDKY